MNTTKNSERLTYGQLNKILISLGFVRRKTSEFTAYREAARDAWIILPIMRSDKLVHDSHLIMVHNTVIWKGIASAETLQDLMTQAHPSGRPTIVPHRRLRTYAIGVKPRRAKPTTNATSDAGQTMRTA